MLRLLLPLIISSFFFPQPAMGTSAQCEALFQPTRTNRSRTMRVFEAYRELVATERSKIWIDDECQSNVIRLFHALSRKLPFLHASDFRVHYITKLGGWLKEPEDGFPVPLFSPQSYTANGRPIRVWRHHAVLEYQGLILDLDYPRDPMSIENYFPMLSRSIEYSHHVAAAKWGIEDLGVYTIPGVQYMQLSPEQAKKGSTMNSHFLRYQAVPLVGLLKK